MTSDYTSADLLPLSGLQHFLFCRRQWALIHIEQQWQENGRTVEGKILHRRVDDPFFTETRKGIITARSVPIASHQLGLSGICDLVECTESPAGICLPGHRGTFIAAPVEYKRGHPKTTACDTVQLCAQAMCLEEMLTITVPIGYLYYGETHHRIPVELTPELRTTVQQAAVEMHAYFQRGYTPKGKKSKACRACSLADICLPSLPTQSNSARVYIQKQINQPE